MCGILAVLRRRAHRPAPATATIAAALQRARQALGLDAADASSTEAQGSPLAERLTAAADALDDARTELRGVPGITALLDAPDLVATITTTAEAFATELDALEHGLDGGAVAPTELERTNAALVRARDGIWSLVHDRLRTADAVADLAGDARSPAALTAYTSIQNALSALDRLEVRGRDSAGVHVLVTGHGLEDATIRQHAAGRLDNELFTSRAVRHRDGALAFVYKRAAEIGELGDNVAVIRAAIRDDELLRTAVAADDAEATVLCHTRWASVGIISEANAHPLNEEESDGVDRPYVAAALNGDVDNHANLIDEHDLSIAQEITTDAKVIPCLVARRIVAGDDPTEAFRSTVATFEGSVAIAASLGSAPDRLELALRGSGQALYVGLADDAFLVASEPYGVVEETGVYLRMDGETPGNPANPTGSRGQVVSIDRRRAGEVEGITRLAFDGTALPVTDAELVRAEITTRDVDRGPFRHYLLKEISEAPRSFMKTLRGKIHQREADGRLAVRLGGETLPATIAERLRSGATRRILAIGQGTAAVAAQGVAAAIQEALAAHDGIEVRTLPATELSGFGMRENMADTLIVAISQSGTTTDTNRTVDLVRRRGAQVIAIVNRRGSDLTDKADGVLYTSDGRDVEMSVASTKAFYAQIAAGFLLAFAIAREVGCVDERAEHELLTGLRELPDAMTTLLGRREPIAKAATELATGRRYWALVGNGANRIAAAEIRIKLSELCYKSMACDATEDKKHIDLSSEPLILVCAAGMTGSTADDVAKEVAIYRAHKALPVLIATEGQQRFAAASAVIEVPPAHPSLAFVLSTMAGHLFGYEAALAIDRLAQPLREIRSAIERLVRDHHDGSTLLEVLASDIAEPVLTFQASLRSGRLNGQLEASTAAELTGVLRFATGIAALDGFAAEFGEVGTPETVVERLTSATTIAIEELTRPVDAIKHQAKTVTVGISRSDENLLTTALVRATLEAGAARDHLTYADLQTLAALAPAVVDVAGYSRYSIGGDEPNATIRQIGSGGVAASMHSRTAGGTRLRGTKHQVAVERRVLVARGRSDDCIVVLVPEVADGKRTNGITLLHVALRDHLDAAALRSVLSAYRNRYSVLQDAVLETEPTFSPDVLEGFTVTELLTEPVHALADAWRRVEARTNPR